MSNVWSHELSENVIADCEQIPRVGHATDKRNRETAKPKANEYRELATLKVNQCRELAAPVAARLTCRRNTNVVSCLGRCRTKTVCRSVNTCVIAAEWAVIVSPNRPCRIRANDTVLAERLPTNGAAIATPNAAECSLHWSRRMRAVVTRNTRDYICTLGRTNDRCVSVAAAG